jgi:flagellar motor switch protein FliM
MPATLSPEEVKALMGALQDGRVPSESGRGARGPVATYDLTSQDRIIRGQMPTLDAINEQIAAQLGMGLAGRTRLALRATAGAATLLKFADLTPLLAPPATVCVMGLGASSGYGLVLLESGVAEGLLGAALGDRRTRDHEVAAEGRREFTAVEQLVLRRLLGVLTEAMARCWDPVIPFQPEILRIEMDPRMANIAPPSDVGIVSAFELAGGLEGRLQVVIPYAAVEPAKALLAAPRRLAQRSDERVAEALAREIEQVTVGIQGLLGRTVIPFSRLLSLEPGETLLLDSDENRPLPVLVQGREKLRARPSVSGGAMALVVETPVSGMRPPVPPSPRGQPPRSDLR